MRGLLPWLLGSQLGLLGLALLLGAWLGPPWWRDLRLDGAVPLALLAGWGLSWLSRRVFQILAPFERFGTRWVHEELLGPLGAGLSRSGKVWLALLSGVCEEALFRGALLPWLGVPWSAALFGLLHTGDRRLWFVGLWSGLVGAALGLYVQVTGELAAAMAAHAANNLASLGWLSSASAGRASTPPREVEVTPRQTRAGAGEVCPPQAGDGESGSGGPPASSTGSAASCPGR